MRKSYQRLAEASEVVSCIKELSPKTVIFDVEPLIAHWDTNAAILAEGVTLFLDKLSTSSEILSVGFVTNSRRRLSIATADSRLYVFYIAFACKPFRTAPYQNLPMPGVVIGDQIATDGVLAWRLDYSFIHYCPKLEGVPLGSRIMRQIGNLIQPFLFSTQNDLDAP